MAATATPTEAATPQAQIAPTSADPLLPQIMTAGDRERKLARITWDDGHRYELIDGEEVVSASPAILHQRMSRGLFRRLDGFVERHRLGEIFTAPPDVRLAEFVVVVPDLCFVSNERAHLIGEQAIEGPPDLVVEILSPSTRRDDLTKKLTLYARYGVREYWVVDVIARRFFAYTLVGDAYAVIPEHDGRIASLVLPGLEISLADLFAGR